MAEVEVNSLSLWNDGTRRAPKIESPPSSPAKSQSISAARVPEAPPNIMLLIEFTDAEFIEANVLAKLTQMERQVSFLREYYAFDKNDDALKFAEHVFAALYFKKSFDATQRDLDALLKRIFDSDSELGDDCKFRLLRALFNLGRFILTGP